MSYNFILIHIITNITAIILFLFGLYYSIIKPKDWFFKHRACMIIATFLLFLSVFFMLYIKEYHTFTFKNKDKKSSLHGIIGIVLLIFLLLQVFIAIMFRKDLGSSY